MKRPIILDGKAFPWGEPNPRGSVIDEDGDVNWGAAAWDDPGVMSCPKCKSYLWNEGMRVRCPDCGEEFDTENKRWRDRMVAK